MLESVFMFACVPGGSVRGGVKGTDGTSEVLRKVCIYSILGLFLYCFKSTKCDSFVLNLIQNKNITLIFIEHESNSI